MEIYMTIFTTHCKKIVLAGFTALFSQLTFSAPSCDILDVAEIPEINSTNGEFSSGFLIKWAHVDLEDITNFGAISKRLYIDGDPYTNPNPDYFYNEEGLWFGYHNADEQRGILSMPIPTTLGTHTIMLEVETPNGIGSCSRQVTVRYDRSNPVITVGRYQVEIQGDNNTVLAFAYDVVDFSGDLTSVQLVAKEAPLGAAIPTMAVNFVGNGANANAGDNRMTFTTPGDYVLQVYAEDLYGENHYSRELFLTVEGTTACFTESNWSHFLSGRAYAFGFYYFSVGSNDILGTAFETTSLLSASPGIWSHVGNCL